METQLVFVFWFFVWVTTTLRPSIVLQKPKLVLDDNKALSLSLAHPFNSTAQIRGVWETLILLFAVHPFAPLASLSLTTTYYQVTNPSSRFCQFPTSLIAPKI